MTSFILHHPIVSLLIVAFLSALIALFVGGICHKAGAADEQINLMQGGAASQDRSARVAHNHEVAGSNPAPATNLPQVQAMDAVEYSGLQHGPAIAPKGLGSTPHKPLMRKVNANECESCNGIAPNNLTASSGLVAQPANGGSEIPPATFIEPQDLIEEKHPCAWCQMEQAIKAQPHESHGICKRHFDEKMAEIKQLNQTHK